MKTSELTGAALDWAAAKCEGEDYRDIATYSGIGQEFSPTNYSTDWAQGGPIIEREGINLFQRKGAAAREGRAWLAYDNKNPEMTGPTPLIAAMRCFVASKMGDTVEIPQELIQ